MSITKKLASSNIEGVSIYSIAEIIKDECMNNGIGHYVADMIAAQAAGKIISAMVQNNDVDKRNE